MKTIKKLEKESRESKVKKLIEKFKKKCKKCKKFEFLGTPCPKHEIEIIDTIAREEGYQQAKEEFKKLIDEVYNRGAWLNASQFKEELKSKIR